MKIDFGLGDSLRNSLAGLGELEGLDWSKLGLGVDGKGIKRSKKTGLGRISKKNALEIEGGAPHLGESHYLNMFKTSHSLSKIHLSMNKPAWLASLMEQGVWDGFIDVFGATMAEVFYESRYLLAQALLDAITYYKPRERNRVERLIRNSTGDCYPFLCRFRSSLVVEYLDVQASFLPSDALTTKFLRMVHLYCGTRKSVYADRSFIPSHERSVLSKKMGVPETGIPPHLLMEDVGEAIEYREDFYDDLETYIYGSYLEPVKDRPQRKDGGRDCGKEGNLRRYLPSVYPIAQIHKALKAGNRTESEAEALATAFLQKGISNAMGFSIDWNKEISQTFSASPGTGKDPAPSSPNPYMDQVSSLVRSASSVQVSPPAPAAPIPASPFYPTETNKRRGRPRKFEQQIQSLQEQLVSKAIEDSKPKSAEPAEPAESEKFVKRESPYKYFALAGNRNRDIFVPTDKTPMNTETERKRFDRRKDILNARLENSGILSGKQLRDLKIAYKDAGSVQSWGEFKEYRQMPDSLSVRCLCYPNEKTAMNPFYDVDGNSVSPALVLKSVLDSGDDDMRKKFKLLFKDLYKHFHIYGEFRDIVVIDGLIVRSPDSRSGIPHTTAKQFYSFTNIINGNLDSCRKLGSPKKN